MRKHVWKQKAILQAQKALFLAKYVLQNQTSNEVQSSTISDSSPNNV